MAGKRVTEEDVIKINELYLQIGTYAGVARKVGFAATTVKKYIVKDYKSESEIEINHFKKLIPEIEDIYIPDLKSVEWFKFCELSEKEKEGCELLKKEIQL